MKQKMKQKTIKTMPIVAVVLFLVFPSVITADSIQMGYSEEIFAMQSDSTKQSSDTIIATAYYKTYDAKTGEFVQEPIRQLTLEEANQLHEELMDIEKQSDSSLEKIRMQIAVLQRWEVLPQDASFEDSLSKIEMMHQNVPMPTQSGVTPNVIVCGPAATSFLTIGGPIIPLHVLLFKLLPPFWYNTSKHRFDAINGTRAVTFLGVMPVTAFYCTATSLINAYGAVIGAHTVISPFISMSILSVLAGVSIAIFDDGFPINIFDWVFGISTTGLIAYIDIT